QILISNILLSIENSTLQLNLKQIKKLLRFYGYINAVNLMSQFSEKILNYDRIYELLFVINQKDKLKINVNKHLKSWYKNAIYDQLELAKKEFIPKNGFGFWISNHSTATMTIGNYGVNTGNAGTVIALIKISQNLKIDHVDKEIVSCLKYLMDFPEDLPFGFFSGQTGIAYALLIGSQYTNDNKFRTRSLNIIDNIPLPDVLKISCDAFNGYASILFVLCKIFESTKHKTLILKAKVYYQELVKNYKENIGWVSGGAALTGAAHGSSGIANAILLYSRIFNDDIAKDFAIKVLKEINSYAVENNLATIQHNNLNTKAAPALGWCHGVEGYLWSMLYNENYIHEFEEEINRCVEIIKDVNILRNPSICHGMSGSLDLWIRLSKIDRHKALAESKINELLNVLKIFAVKQKGHITWYSDEAGKTNFDLWVGSLGPSIIISRLINDH
ncbi:MAG: hypothetical protein MUE72_09140, partial [Chitinophagaceae bacterium]|nr:hypothetical protein [Chitinophagaceae bacterium]